MISDTLLSLHSVKTPLIEIMKVPLVQFGPTRQEWQMLIGEIESKVDYFHLNMDRHVADCYLMQTGCLGSFLLRNSSIHGEDYYNLVLSVRGYHSVKHFQIKWDGQFFTFGLQTFNDLDTFLMYIRSTPILGESSGSFLTVKRGISKSTSENRFDSVYACTSDLEYVDPIFHSPSPSPELSIASKEGYLSVQTKYFKKWQTIWVVINKMTVYCFKTKELRNAYQTFDLREYAVRIDNDSPLKNGFKLVNCKREIVFRTNTNEEVHSWLYLINWKLQNCKESFSSSCSF